MPPRLPPIRPLIRWIRMKVVVDTLGLEFERVTFYTGMAARSPAFAKASAGGPAILIASANLFALGRGSAGSEIVCR
jgi:hypothetical protein